MPRPAATAGAWWCLIALLGLPALVLPLVDLQAPDARWPALAQALVLRPDHGLHQPAWVWWTAAWLHGSVPHLWRNLAALGLIGVLGGALHAGRREAVLLALAWPLTQLGMLAQTDLQRYIGLSGVLHAAVALLLAQAMVTRPRDIPGPWLWLGLTGLLLKVLLENPWEMTLVADPRSAINVAPWVHFCGAAIGIGLGCASGLARTRQSRGPSAS